MSAAQPSDVPVEGSGGNEAHRGAVDMGAGVIAYAPHVWAIWGDNGTGHLTDLVGLVDHADKLLPFCRDYEGEGEYERVPTGDNDVIFIRRPGGKPEFLAYLMEVE